jgi:alkanesulfonate monooxygenase SsuD/methylene tetrahydromethanopterin reductase-like flavin-dependent oxidoreductase (luciferase family)
MAARYAEEWNGVYLTPRQIAELNSRLDELLTAEGRRPEDLRRSMMTGPVFGLNQDDLARKMARYNRSAEELRERGMVVGTANEVVEQLGQIAEAGLYRVMLQWLDLDDMEGLEAFARDVLPQVHAS